ncbi:hypothetical protein AM586_18270 [Massilia sp. WG5]|nr:hypothetical protein AM586_18270 [Massilia sp. WG5]
MLATPFESVRALPEAGVSTAVLSLLVNLTATPARARPLLSFTTAFAVPGAVDETVVTGAPLASLSEIASEACAEGMPGAAAALHEGRLPLRDGSRFWQPLSDPPPHAASVPARAPAVARMLAR